MKKPAKKQPEPESEELIEKFNEWLLIKKHTSKTALRYAGTARQFLCWLTGQNIEVENVSYNDILAYAEHCKTRGNKQRSIQKTVNVLVHLYNCLLQQGRVSENPAGNVDIKGIKRTTLYNVLSAEELEGIYQSYDTTESPAVLNARSLGKLPPQQHSMLAKKRNRIILALMVYQGASAADIARLEITHLDLKAGKITFPQTSRCNGRALKLEAHQIYELMDYLYQDRKELLSLTGKQTAALFTSTGASLNIHNLISILLESIQQKHPQVKNIQQLRASVITNWLKVHSLRKVQYMAGHKYISSTEAYQVNNIEALQQQVNQYHPMG